MSDKLDASLKAFAFNQPSPATEAIMDAHRERFRALAVYMDGAIPECREKSLAFIALEAAAMWAMKALSHSDHGGGQ